MFVTLTHANDGKLIDFVAAHIFYVRVSEAQKATIVVSAGGAFAPVKETVDEVKRLLKECNKSE